MFFIRTTRLTSRLGYVIKHGYVLQLFISQYRNLVDKGLSVGRPLTHDPRVIQTFEINILWNMTTSIPGTLPFENVCGVLSSTKIYCPSATRRSSVCSISAPRLAYTSVFWACRHLEAPELMSRRIQLPLSQSHQNDFVGIIEQRIHNN